MGKKLRFLMVAAAIALFSTNAVAQDNQDSAKEERVSANGSYQFRPSWGVGLQYGLTFTDMSNWNDYLLIPARQNYFDVNFVAEHELYVEWTPVEGFRISAFGGYQSLYISDTGFNYGYAGLEPAFSVRRSFYEFAVGIGLGYGKSWLDSKTNDMEGHGLLVRPFVEARFYLCDIFALYLRVAFGYYKEFGLEPTPYAKTRDLDNQINEDKLSYAGPNVAVGFRFGDYAEPVLTVGDEDGDGVYDDIDACPKEAGTEEFYGCPNPDSDGDGYCDPWVAEKDLSEMFNDVCKGSDKCAQDVEDVDGFEDEDGCPDPDNDGDGFCDPWVAEQGLADKYADVCKGSDPEPDAAEDVDGFQDDDGAPDADNDGDGFCDPWVADQGLSDKYSSYCTGKDLCPDVAAGPEFNGCKNPDPDGDGYCDAWVYDQKLQSYFSQCKGKDMCPDEKGEDDKGCLVRRVVVTKDHIQINDKIFFNLNKATIKSESDSLLEEIAQVIKDNPQIKKIEIQGHTDASGNAKKNQKLSQDRAKAVHDRLIKLGVDKSRLTYKGFGSSSPLIPLEAGQKKETEEQAAANRRVEFMILEQDDVKTVVPVTELQKQSKVPAANDTKADTKKADTKADTKKTEKRSEKADTKKADTKKADTKKADTKKTDSKKDDSKKGDAAKAVDKAKADAKAATDKAKADAKAANDKAKDAAKDAKAKTDKANNNAKAAAANAAAAKAAAEAAAKAAANKK